MQGLRIQSWPRSAPAAHSLDSLAFLETLLPDSSSLCSSQGKAHSSLPCLLGRPGERRPVPESRVVECSRNCPGCDWPDSPLAILQYTREGKLHIGLYTGHQTGGHEPILCMCYSLEFSGLCTSKNLGFSTILCFYLITSSVVIFLFL